jgi:hypothetical protein
MKRVLIVCHNYNSAKRRFHDIVHRTESSIVRACQAQLTIESDDTRYEFISSHASDKLQGRTFSSIIIDEMVELTDEQTAMIMSRKR